MGVDRAAVVRKADEFVRQGKLDLAIAEYRALLDQQPSDLSAANTLGDLYARTGEIARAVEQFTRLAESEHAQGFTSKAIALYKKALKIDPGCDQALSQLAEIALGQELLADATLYWNRLVQHRRERNDAPGVAQALIRLAGVAVAKADTKLAAARAAEPHMDAVVTARLYAAAAEALAREGRESDALDAWVEAAGRTDDAVVRHAAARACLAGGALDRAESFLSVEAAGDDPALLWAVGERAAAAGDETVATRALGRYRTLVPDDAARASALLAPWESVAAPMTEMAVPEEASPLDESEEVDLAVLLTGAPEDAPVPADGQVALDAETAIDGPATDETPVEVLRFGEAPAEVAVAPTTENAAPADAWHAEGSQEVDLAALLADPTPAPNEAAIDEPPVLEVVPDDDVIELSAAPLPVDPLSDEADPEMDEATTIAQLQAAADTPALQFQAAAQLGRWFLQRGQVDRGVEWLERACAVPSQVREHGLAARYDLADALERAGHQDRALACWSDLEFEAGSYRDVADRLARLTRALG